MLVVRLKIFEKMDFSNRVVIVTGASAGIGAATALLFAQHSANLVLVGRNVKSLEIISKKCEESKGIKPLIIRAELTNDEEVKNIVAKTIEKHGRIDILVNNAGVGIMAKITDGIEHYDRAMAINVRAAYLLTSLAVPYLIKSKGNIVNVSSIASMKPISDLKFLAYGMSKAAMDNFTKYLAIELGPLGVRVNSVNPGATKTEFLLSSGMNNTHVLLEDRAKIVPLRKIAQSEEVAYSILHLASDRAGSITGSHLVIDNGELLM